MPTLRTSTQRSTSRIRQIVVFRFQRIRPNQTVVTRSFTLRNATNSGEVIVSQRAATGTAAVRYQIVNATTGRPVTNSITVTGNRTVTLPFRGLPAGTDRLRITNIGTSNVAVTGAILVF